MKTCQWHINVSVRGIVTRSHQQDRLDIGVCMHFVYEHVTSVCVSVYLCMASQRIYLQVASMHVCGSPRPAERNDSATHR